MRKNKVVVNKFESADFSAELVSSFVSWVKYRINYSLLLSDMVERLGRGESVTLGPFIANHVVGIARRTPVSVFTEYSNDSAESALWKTTSELLDGDYFAGNFWNVFEGMKDKFIEVHY